MTKVSFFKDSDRINGFCLAGHSTQSCDDQNGKIVCAAVSSAAYMAANTLTEVVGCDCDISVEDGYMSLTVVREADGAQAVLRGFMLHMQQLAEQYSNIELNLEV